VKTPVALFLAVSLLANVALLTLLGWRGDTTPTSGPASTSSSSHRSNPTPPADYAATLDPRLWPALVTDDSLVLRARLRAAGFPEDLVRAAAKAMVASRFAARRREIEGPLPDVPYWKTRLPRYDSAVTTALEALSRERETLNRQLVADDFRHPLPSLITDLRRDYEAYAPGKAEALLRLRLDYDAQRKDRDDRLSPREKEARIALLEKEERADLARLLSPRELEDHDLRNSRTSVVLRYKLGTFNPTEAEFRTLHSLLFPLDNSGLSRTTNGAEAEAYFAAKDAVDRQIRTALGDARYGDYVRAQDENFGRVTALVQRLALPPATANRLYDLEHRTRHQADALQNDAALSAELRNAQLAALTASTAAALTATLGPRGAEAYRQNTGEWLKILQPRRIPGR
jgi:hypothetical protein